MQPARHVKRLHVQAASDEDARRAATAIADALHTATLPGGDAGPLVIIRKLSLGKIPADAAPASLALHIERITQEMTREMAWSGAASQAQQKADANVVVFSTRADAILRLSRLHARGNIAAEWFWPRVVSEWKPSQPQAEGWMKLLDAAHDSPEAAILASAIVAEAIDSGADERMLSAVPVSRGLRWLKALGWSNWTGAPDNEARVWSPGGNISILKKWGRRWPARDTRTVWLGTVLALHAQPALSAYSALPARIAGSLEVLLRDEPAQRSSSRTPSIGVQSERQDSSTPFSPPPHEHFAGKTTPFAEPLATDNASANHAHAPDSISQISEPRQKIANTALRQDLSTNYAGLFFLIPLLVHAGFPSWISSRSDLLEMGFPLRFLVYAARRAGLRRGDPLELKLLGEELQDSPADQIYREWLTRVRKWCKKNAKIGLIAVIRRNGMVATTDSHIDCFFDLAQADIRLRRFALDINPGWVPWLGRVVRFHYIDANDKTTS